MCGIVGVWDREGRWNPDALRDFVAQVCKALRWRGPDDHGMWSDNASGIVLGHRRLSILDLSPSGHQPMISASGRYVIIYNGEIYNALDYRDVFPSLKGQSDTEILLEGCEAWGPVEACRRFRGMFAFALWDTLNKTLYLARDRVGVKPLYWGKVDSLLVFASELKALHHCPGWKGTLCQEAVSCFFQLGYVMDPLAIYEGFQKLVPGTVVQVSAQGMTTSHCFWDHHTLVHSTPLALSSTQEALQTLEDLLLDNVQRRMVCDVPIGSFLSGGIDSGLVTAMMSHLQKKHNGDTVRSFCIGFEMNNYNEAPNAEAVAHHIGTRHITTYMTGKDALDVLSEAQWDEPFADSSQLATAFVCKQARNNGIVVCLSGDGGDESFAGYTRYLALEILRKKERWIPLWLKKIVITLGEHLPWIHHLEKVQKVVRVLKSTTLWEWYEEICTQYPTKGLWKAPLFSLPFPTTELDHSIASMQYWDLLSYLPGDILTKVDRASMAYSLEVRSPFLDHTLIEYGWALPLHHRIYNGQSKYLLRQLALKWLPKKIAQDKKMGFGVPLGHWLRTDLRQWAKGLLTSESLDAAGFCEKAVLDLWDTHLKGRANFGYRLWNTLMFLHWTQNNKRI